ncbi:MAG TPA: glycosyltransferase family 4 protein [Terracidiphilus sp.]|nr:glycosyltransferase family 4 protein [Terracidiphilus sp.]
MKIAVLWTRLSGYLNACLRELAGREGVELFVSHQAPNSEAPYDDGQFAWIRDRFTWRSNQDTEALEPRVDAFDPDVIVLAGWHVPAYRQLSRARKGRSWRVMIMDNPWQGTWKQRAGVCISPFHVRPVADVAWLPGERQAVFARKLGFSQREILRGSFSCDQPQFAARHLDRVAQGRPVQRRFLFAGRFVEAKGIRILAEAYAIYRRYAQHPWPLSCCGSGSLRHLLEGMPGVELEGFVQPQDLAGKLASAGCLILASVFEPWALAVHEATSAGLLVLASEIVGATVHLVQPNYNGFIFDDKDAEGLAQLMTRVSSMSDERLDAMSRASYLLSQQYSPALWANTLIDEFHARGAPEART